MGGAVGALVGLEVGALVGFRVGVLVGFGVGVPVGFGVGFGVGVMVGFGVGFGVGVLVGIAVGAWVVGIAVGDLVGHAGVARHRMVWAFGLASPAVEHWASLAGDLDLVAVHTGSCPVLVEGSCPQAVGHAGAEVSTQSTH